MRSEIIFFNNVYSSHIALEIIAVNTTRLVKGFCLGGKIKPEKQFKKKKYQRVTYVLYTMSGPSLTKLSLTFVCVNKPTFFASTY